MICYTYFEEVPKIENCPKRKESQRDLIEICRKSWEKYGWKLVVLCEKDAENHSFYEQYKQIISSLPSVNPPLYEYHCFMRWLAMSNVGGGIMIDYDVMNLGIGDISFFNFDKLTVYQGHVPCVVSGESDHYLETLKKFIDLKDDKNCIQIINGRPHMSDMLMLIGGNINFRKLNIVSTYPNIGNLVHCSQESCVSNKKNKYEAMSELSTKTIY